MFPHEFTRRLKPPEAQLLLALIYFAKDKAECWPSLAKVREQAGGMSEMTAHRAMRGLVAHGLIRIEPDKSKASHRRYVLTWMESGASDICTRTPPDLVPKQELELRANPVPIVQMVGAGIDPGSMGGAPAPATTEEQIRHDVKALVRRGIVERRSDAEIEVDVLRLLRFIARDLVARELDPAHDTRPVRNLRVVSP